VSRHKIVRRRILALGAVALAALVVFALVKITGRSNSAPPPTTPTIVLAKPFRIVFPEGLNREEMAHRVQVVAKIAQGKTKKHVRLSKSGYLAWSRPRAVSGFGSKKRSLEGFLFPATYDFLAATTSKELVQKQLDAFGENWRKIDLSYARTKNLTPYDVLIIASLIEREAQLPRERALVSAVIYNRLKQGMPLGIDATIRYYTNNWTRPIRQSELQADEPYNSRLNRSLPPTPIGNPGLASLKAAAKPAKKSYLFYVRKPGNSGEHAFSSTDAQFQRDVKRYQDARQGG
jgi:uncharacterized YceG family protein